MSHEAYSPVGYIHAADMYCLDCIIVIVTGNYPDADLGYGNCNCTECVLDRGAQAAGITDRMDEGSFDSGYFPKSIPYHNDLHSECGPESYGYSPEDPEWQSQYCDSTCARCHDVIDGVSHIGGPDVCPVYDSRE